MDLSLVSYRTTHRLGVRVKKMGECDTRFNAVVDPKKRVAVILHNDLFKPDSQFVGTDTDRNKAFTALLYTMTNDVVEFNHVLCLFETLGGDPLYAMHILCIEVDTKRREDGPHNALLQELAAMPSITWHSMLKFMSQHQLSVHPMTFVFETLSMATDWSSSKEPKSPTFAEYTAWVAENLGFNPDTVLRPPSPTPTLDYEQSARDADMFATD
jgi:hypothetical protein